MFSGSADKRFGERLIKGADRDVEKLNRLNNEIKLMDYRLNRICSVGIEHFTDLNISLVSGTAAAKGITTVPTNESFNASNAFIDQRSKAVDGVIGSV